MHNLFYPKRIAVIGVSERQDNMGRLIMENIVKFNFSGDVLPVGPRGGTVCGRKILTAVDQLPAGIDVAVIITPAVTVPDIIDQCGQKKIPWAIVETGGFGELSTTGEELGDELLSRARKGKIRVVGPNGLGIISMDPSLVTPFVPMRTEALKRGSVAVLAQSGAVMYALVNQLSSNNIGISKAVSFGNKLDLDEIDYLTYFIDDDKTQIIVLYLEGIKRGHQLLEIVKRTTKPIIIHKANRYSLTSRIAMFHTQALATDDGVVDAAFNEAGIIRAHTYREVVDWVKIMSLPPMHGNNLVIISRSGGVAITAADFAVESAFTLFSLSETFLSKVQEKSGPKVIKRTNPLDLGDFFNFDFFAEVTEDVLKEGADGVFFQHGAATDEEVAGTIPLGETFRRLSNEYQKPIALCLLSDDRNTAHIKQTLEFPLFADPHDAIQALAMSRDRHQRIQEREVDDAIPQLPFERHSIQEILHRARQDKRPLFLTEALEIVRAAGISCARWGVCRDVDEALACANDLGYPTVLKINCPSVLHKTDIGAVAHDIHDQRGLKEAFEKLTQQAQTRGVENGIIVQEVISHGVEMILGGRVDESFGPVGMLGFGGSYTEIFGDTVLRMLPLTEKKVETMLHELRGYPLLIGDRVLTPFDIEQLTEALLRLSQLMVTFEEIKGIDVNPLFVLRQGQGAVAVDARIITET
jgi:acyl-CoA synthetase (NDP forming)